MQCDFKQDENNEKLTLITCLLIAVLAVGEFVGVFINGADEMIYKN